MKILVISVHPDDETLGAGGTLLRHKDQGDELYWVTVTAMKKKDGYSIKQIESRNQEIKKVEIQYGIKRKYQLNFSPSKLDTVPVDELVQTFSKIMKEVGPETIYLPFRGDVHSDHRIIFEAAFACTKQFRYPSIRKILMMETLSETEFSCQAFEDIFIPNYFVDISSYLNKKIEIMEIYQSELGAHPFPRSKKNIKALATFRGATAGVKYAEAFMLLKSIKR
jgi:LmbE family N-acetylglucosaminyl deacetylase